MKVCPTAISIPLERYADKRQVSVSNVRYMSVRDELPCRYFCCGQLWVCYNLLETPQSGKLTITHPNSIYMGSVVCLSMKDVPDAAIYSSKHIRTMETLDFLHIPPYHLYFLLTTVNKLEESAFRAILVSYHHRHKKLPKIPKLSRKSKLAQTKAWLKLTFYCQEY